MAQTLAELLTRLNELISDPKNQKFTETAKKRALNTCLQDLVSSRTLSYVRSTDIQFRDGERVYEFPEDMLEPIGMMIQAVDGEVIVNASWRSLVGNIEFSATTGVDPSVFWQQTSSTGGRISLRDIVPDNQFMATPEYNSAEMAATVVTQVSIPTTAAADTIWVDSYDSGNYVYKASEGYSAVADYATLTVEAEDRPSGTAADLVFTAVTAGIQYINLAIAVTTDPASVTETGSGTRADPYIVTLSLPTTDSSNDTIISLLATSTVVRATGADATDGSFTPLASTEMDNAASQYWVPQYIHLVYAAIYPKLYSDTDALVDSIPVIIREGDCLPLMAAVKLLKMVRGDERLIIMTRQYQQDYEEILDRVRRHRALSGPPNDMTPA